MGVVVNYGNDHTDSLVLKLRARYPVRAAELYALWTAFQVYARHLARIGVTLNLVTDSKVALGMIGRRRGGAAQEIDWHLRNRSAQGYLCESGGTPVAATALGRPTDWLGKQGHIGGKMDHQKDGWNIGQRGVPCDMAGGVDAGG